MTGAEFFAAVASYCGATNASVTSWIRSKHHNAVVGGVTDSPHLYGLGVDVVYDAPVELHRAVDTARLYRLVVIREHDHDHLQPLDWSAR